MANVRVTRDEYTAEGRQFQKTLEELNKLACFIGFQHGNGTEEDGTDLCDIAAWNELGTSQGIPSRPFIRNTVDLHQDEINQMLDKMAEQVINGATAEKVLRQMGVYFKGQMQEEITNGEYVPNAPVTIRKKKSDKPLIDTGRMRSSVQYQIKKKGDL